MPIQAYGLTTERWTAKANQDGGNGIMGGISTRITWQGQAGEDEAITAVDLVLPEGTVFDPESVSVTVLDGLDRLDVDAAVQAGPDHDILVNFAEPAPAGTMVMVEVNGAELPAAGGDFPVAGTYTVEGSGPADIPTADKVISVIGVTPSEQLSGWLADQDWVKAWNSVKFLHLFFDPTIIVTSVPAVLGGWFIALGLVIISFPLAIPLGLMWSFMRMAKSRFPRAVASTYINIIRGTPLFLQIYIAFFGLPLMGISIGNFPLGCIVLVLNSSAYLAEIFRAGIQSIPKGQFEASRSLGMNGAQTMVFVIIPQAVRRVIPTMTSEFILMYKDTSLLAAVGVYEIIMQAKVITAATGNMTPYIVGAAFYLVVTIPLTRLINHMENRMAAGRPRKHKKGAPVPIAPVSAAPLAEGGLSAEAADEAAVARAIRMSETFSASTAPHTPLKNLREEQSSQKRAARTAGQRSATGRHEAKKRKEDRHD